jgi:hypothetical protein
MQRSIPNAAFLFAKDNLKGIGAVAQSANS